MTENYEVDASLDMSTESKIHIPTVTNTQEGLFAGYRNAVVYRENSILSVAPKPRDFKQVNIALKTTQWNLTTLYEKPVVDYPYKRTLQVEIPIPEIFGTYKFGSVSLYFCMSIPVEEVNECKTNDPTLWSFTLDTGRLFDLAVPSLTFYEPSVHSSFRWLMSITGRLAASVFRPQTVFYTIGFRTKELSNTTLDARINVNADLQAITLAPYKKPGTPDLAQLSPGDLPDDWSDVASECDF